jgi:hypothetical protein
MMSLILDWLVIPLSVLAVTGPAAALVFIALLQRASWRGLALFWLGLAATTVLLGLFITYTFGNFFPGPGCFISVLTPLAVLITFSFLHFRARQLKSVLNSEGARHWLKAGMMLIPLLQLSAPMISVGYSQTCDAINRQAAKPLIAALEKHKNETGSYLPADHPDSPYQEDLSYLIPDHLAAVPPRACVVSFFETSTSHSAPAGWHLYYCNRNPGRDVLLLVPIIGSDSEQVYHLNTGSWSRGNAFDGFCN